VKVAGTPNNLPPGLYEAGVYETTAHDVYETTAHDTGAYDTSAYGPGPAGPGPAGPGPAGPGGPGQQNPYDGNATAAYDMGAPYDQGAPPYERGTSPYGTGATSAQPPYGEPDAPPYGEPDARPLDFEDVRRTPHASNKRLIRFAAVAAAVAVVGGGGVAWAVTGSSGGGKADAGRQVQAQAPAPAPLTDAQRKDAADKRRKELKKRASRAARDEVSRPKLLARGTPPPTKKPGVPTAGDPTPVGEAQQIARAMLSDFGWSPSSQFGCLVNLWNKESHWNTHAANGSGAYGIPQALPGSKMSSAGPDWQNNAHTQIKWGLGYIRDRYSTPCGAWSHSQSTGWY
jgi:hypothetical protein